MVVFERGDDEVVGVIVKKFGAAVPKGGFVLVALENHFRAVAEAVALAEIFRDTAHQKSRPLARRMKNPGQHGGSRGLAVRAAYDDGVLAGKKDFFEDFGHGAVR